MQRTITIYPLGERIETQDQCFVVDCGCKTFMFISKEELLEFLHAYIQNPEGFEQAYYQIADEREMTKRPKQELADKTNADMVQRATLRPPTTEATGGAKRTASIYQRIINNQM